MIAYLTAIMTLTSYLVAGAFVLLSGPLSLGLPFLAFCLAAGLWLVWRVQGRRRAARLG